jgi:glycosyltransferase involved in cell wall biosynthesis
VTLRVLFDATSLDDRPSGTKTRLMILAPGLARRGFDVGVAHGPELDAETKALLSPASTFQTASGLPRRAVLRLVAQPRLRARALGSWRPDVVVDETLPPPAAKDGARSIFTVHDLRRLRTSGPTAVLYRAALKRALLLADVVHAVSKSVRDELVALGVDAAKIDVVPNATRRRDAAELSADALPPSISRSPFVFAVGHAEERKDFDLVRTIGRRFEGRFVVVRAGRGVVEGPNVVDLGVVSDRARDALYAAAVATLAPSRLEGFGLAPLEAAACGGVVVASDIPAHREVLGDAAVFFPPGDAEAAASSMRKAAGKSDVERAATAAGARARAALFEPDRAVDAFVASLSRLQ